MGISIFIYTYVCIILKDIGLSEENEICLENKKSASERTTMAAKCEIFELQ